MVLDLLDLVKARQSIQQCNYENNGILTDFGSCDLDRDNPCLILNAYDQFTKSQNHAKGFIVMFNFGMFCNFLMGLTVT